MSEHGNAVWRACVAYVPAHDAEDVLQNTFLKFAMHDQAFSQVYLSLVEGYTASEISEMTNMPENTVYSWISRGRKRLREVLS